MSVTKKQEEGQAQYETERSGASKRFNAGLSAADSAFDVGLCWPLSAQDACELASCLSAKEHSLRVCKRLQDQTRASFQ